MLELLKAGIALGGSALAAAWDLKTTEIPDWIPVAMIILGIGFHAYESVTTGDFGPLRASLSVSALLFLFSLLMYYLGYWGGGDGELLIAVGALMATYPSKFVPFSLGFFINTFLVGAVYSILYSAVFVSKNARIRREFYKSLYRDRAMISATTLGVFALFLGIFFVVRAPPALAYYPFVIATLIFALLVLYRFARIVEIRAFYRRIPASRLRAGDMIGEDIPQLGMYKRLIRGLTAAEVAKIKAKKRFVVIREGVRFGPVFPLALLITLLYGDIFTILL